MDRPTDPLVAVLATICTALGASGAALLRVRGDRLVPVAAYGATEGLPLDAPALGEPAHAPQRGTRYPLAFGGRVEGLLLVAGVSPAGRAGRRAALVPLLDLLALALRHVRSAEEREGVLATLRESQARLLEANSRLQAAVDEQATTLLQVIQQERLRALGEMASGIAHDFNNALSPVLGFTELLLADRSGFGQHPKVRRHLELVRAGAQDAAGIVRRLREFYRRRASDDVSQAVEVGPLLRQVVTLTQPEWREQALAAGRAIRVEVDLPAGTAVTGNAEDLRQALANLILNAVDAMPAGGTITLLARPSERHVTLSVADTGTGMTEEVRRRCLEPFFTTKGQRGGGLGLSMVYGIVRRHGGELHVETATGQGTTISLRLQIALHQPGDGDEAGETEAL